MQLFYLKYRVKPFFDAQLLLVVDEIFVHKKSSDKICVAPHIPSIDTFLVIKVIISNDKFIATYTMKKIWGKI